MSSPSDVTSGQTQSTSNGHVSHKCQEPGQENGFIANHVLLQRDYTVEPDVRERKPEKTRCNKSNDVIAADASRYSNGVINLSPGLPGISVAVLGSFMSLWPPLCVWFFWLACDSYQCSLDSLGRKMLRKVPDFTVVDFIWKNIPDVNGYAVKLYGSWMLLQVALFLALPGRIRRGTATPAGNVLSYKCNGLGAWIVSHVLFFILVKKDYISATVISDNWGSLMVISNVFGILLALFSYAKAIHFPSHPEDRCFSGSKFYDFFMGIEHNPRIGAFDFKLFFNGRPGIVAWTLINLSFAAKQYEELGYISNSMILLNILHAAYVLDFFCNESWYLRTIDIAHDHFGFYLAWGDSAWLPFMYTLQGCYLARHPGRLPWWAFVAILCLGFIGYFIFRSVNHQKDYFRVEMKTNGKCVIWGEPARYILASYTTTDAIEKKSYLLASGWWGLSRHFNYIGDMINALSYCLTCGFSHVLPFFYFFYMVVLLVHRSFRDDIRCKQKYGAAWDRYRQLVPYRIIPYVF